MDDRNIWLVNRTNSPIEICVQELKKWIVFESLRPQQLPFSIGLQYVGKFFGLVICDHPEKYFSQEKLKQIVIRDAGIGDLLLLEPVLRAQAAGNVDLSIASMFPEVYENCEYLKENIRLPAKENLTKIKLEEYECYEDLRNYSETAASRGVKHRTDIYNEKFNLQLNDKEPKLYFNDTEESILNKRPGKKYFGLQCDGSHSYRRYYRGLELINYIIKQSPDNICVVLGDKRFVKCEKHKQIIDYQEQTTVREAINIIRNLDYMIAVDSGLMHVALTLHIPTLCLFGIIHPELRVKYYTGKYKAYTKNLKCIGCGSLHMYKCQYGDMKADLTFRAPCMDISPEEIYPGIAELDKMILPEKIETIVDKRVNIIERPIKTKLTLPIIVLNEEKNLPRFIELVIKNKAIGRVIAIDGGSTDNTVDLLTRAGAQVYVHTYDKNYHDMQAMQRNYSCSFVKDGEKILIMDIDECFSQELADYLPELAESNIQYGLISRRTYKYYADTQFPDRRIKDYPDYQPRFFTWNRKYKWAVSPHHNVYNVPTPIRVNKDIIHFECENKDRVGLEKQWFDMQKLTRGIYI